MTITGQKTTFFRACSDIEISRKKESLSVIPHKATVFGESSRSFSRYFPGLRDSFVQPTELVELACYVVGV